MCGRKAIKAIKAFGILALRSNRKKKKSAIDYNLVEKFN